MTDSDIARLERALERAAERTEIALATMAGAVSDLRAHIAVIDTRAEERLRRCDSHARRIDALEERREVTGVGPPPGAVTLDQASMRMILYVLGALLLGGSAGASGWAALFGGG